MATPEMEEPLWNTIADEMRRREDMARTATQQIAQRVGQIHTQYPFLSPGVKLSAAKGGLTDEQIEAIAKKAAPVSTKPKEENKGGLWNKISSGFKTASRYTTAGLEFIPQFTVGGVAQIFDKNEDVSGWFISTDLGSMIANGDEAGSGFFIGGRAKELQGERARRYRGEINNEAFTLGRGLASTFLEDDTIQYRLLSGAVDFAAAIAIPSIPIASQVGKTARNLQELGEAGKVTEFVADLSRTVGKGSKEIGITQLSKVERDALRSQVGLVGNAVDLEQANRFFKTDFGRRIIKRTAETNDFSETWELWGKKIDPATTMRLANAKTEQQVMSELLDVLGTQVTNRAGVGGGRRAYVSLAQRNKLIDSQPFGEGVSRAFAKLPRTNINLFQAETPREQIQQLETLDRALKLFKVAGAKLDAKGNPILDKAGNVAVPDLRRDFLNRAASLLTEQNANKINNFYDELEEEAKNAMVRFGTPRETVDEIFRNFKTYKENTTIFDVDELGQQTDNGVYKMIHNLPAGSDDIAIIGPQTVGELGRKEFFIPDPKQVRRLTNRHNWIWVKKDPNIESLRASAQLRLPLAAVEFFQEQIWRKYITMTMGNFTRNTIDSQLSLAMSGKSGAITPFTHPFQWWSMVGKKTGRGTLTLSDWEMLKGEGIDDAIRDYREATGTILEAYYKDPLATRRRAAKLGIAKPYQRRLDVVDPDFVRAHGDELGRINADWSMRMLAQGKSIDEVVDLVQKGDKDAVRWFRTMNDRYKGGQPIFNKTTRQMSHESIDLEQGDNLRFLLQGNLARLDRITGQNMELRDVVGLGLLTGRREVVDSKYIAGDLRVGGRVEVTEVRTIGKKKVKRTYLANVDAISNTAKGTDVTVVPYAFDGFGDNTKKLENLLSDDGIYKDPNMPMMAVGEIRDPKNPQAQLLLKSMDQMISSFHSFLYTKPIATLERSPVFRNLYYQWIDKLAISLDEASVNKIIDDINDITNDPENYLTPGLWTKLQDFKANPDKLYGTLSADEVSSYASGSALDEYQKMVYNAVDRRNSTDILRLISPFAQQQAEFLGRMARFAATPIAGGSLGYLPNLKTARKMQLLIEGGRDADPDGDGRGLFYKDPQSGQWSFAFPLTGELSKAALGVNAQLTAPVRGIFLGLDVRPGLGPFATVAASKILKDTPSLDFVRQVLLPYGEKQNITDTLVPSYVKKVYDGITGQTNGRFFANTYAETTQALSATGKYDLSDPDQRDKMLEDARGKAKWLTVLRGVTQFTGPAAGDYDIKVETEVGDVHTAGLAAALQSLRDENYDTATLRFIEVFGEDAFAYLSGKTVAVAGGLEGSKPFGDFERTNENLFRIYPDVAGFFGPVGTEFDFEVYTRQLRTGGRRRLTPSELLDASEKVIGMAFYRDMKEYLGTKLNQESRDYLANYKKLLEDKYPGFAKSSYDPQKTGRDITRLFEAAKRDDLASNGVAQGVLYYEQVRNAALAEAQRRGFNSLNSDKLSDLHDYMESYANAIIEKYPEFSRVYDRLLSQEID